ncbi:unnamed protein product [Mycena citricolor]|uniref:HSF-type DNA-binding domain-containing protein n=1 Tax=Mycena citricolor TaxID=2018698 RepID=A0AAD2HR39_9AGAR|nr:unnamed protein product [Mycena citricolor]
MASSKQVALARAPRTSNNDGQLTRIPAFLNKIYEMVNDDRTNNLIEWSPSGDTFYVYDQEKFAMEVLPRWFKHKNFASFVRQLNMYGFHKIPHLQQGVLKSETESEHWNFVHPNFKRDQPDLLCLIQRKKSTTANEDERNEIVNTTTQVTGNSQLDIQSIVNGIAAIKRHQTTISTELNELKRNNELLWRESEAARTRHQKQQDTINRIVKFLAGVFGHAGSPVHKEDVGSASPSRVSVVPVRQSRLMIEGSTPTRTDLASDGDSPAAFASIETPPSIASPIDRPISPSTTALFSSPSTPQTLATEPLPESTDLGTMQRTRSPSSNPDLDAFFQGLSGMSPAEIQQLMNSMTVPTIPEFPASDPGSSSLMQYSPQTPAFDLSQLGSFPLLSPSPPPLDDVANQVGKSWAAAHDIEQDVDAVDNKINNLMDQFQIPNASLDSLTPLDPDDLTADLGHGPAVDSDNDLFHSFLKGLGEDGALNLHPDVPNTLLETIPEVNDLPDVEPPALQRPTKKRKSDVATPETLPEALAKRRKGR